jgi:peptide/nickel transport system permease protein
MAVAAEPHQAAPHWASGLRRRIRLVWGPTEGKVGVLLLALFVCVAVLGPTLAPYNPYTIGVGAPVAGPSAQHWLGTDELGRDVFSRLLYGGRSVIGGPLLATCVAFAVGGSIGMISAYKGGRTDSVLTRVIDVLISLPPLLIILVIVAASGSSTPALIIAVAVVFVPRIARILRGATQGVVGREYIQAAQSRGESTAYIVFSEILPNIGPSAFVEFTVRLAWAVIFFATLNFLGLGAQPPSANWGVMVSEERTIIEQNPFAALAPALAIGVIAVGFSLIADAVTRGYGLDQDSEFLR